MPELPEVECLRRSLEPHLLGRRIERARLLRADMLCIDPTSSDTPPAHALLEGMTIASIQRRGKHLALVAEKPGGGVLEIHLGMTGQVRVAPVSESRTLEPHTHATWELAEDHRSAACMTFRDPRRFGGLWAFASWDALLRARWSGLGPDAWTIEDEEFEARLGKTRRAIKAALLDQSILAGVGNIYADEALFRARIHPARRACTLGPDERRALGSQVRAVLTDAIEARGSTLRDYRDANGEPGATQLEHRAYGRGTLPCLRCATPMRTVTLAQRTTTFCPACQPKRPPRPVGSAKADPGSSGGAA